MDERINEMPNPMGFGIFFTRIYEVKRPINILFFDIQTIFKFIRIMINPYGNCHRLRGKVKDNMGEVYGNKYIYILLEVVL